MFVLRRVSLNRQKLKRGRKRKDWKSSFDPFWTE